LVDETCGKILSFFIFREEKIRFNELYRTLNGLGLKMSKPTLSSHLKHLIKDRVLKKRKEGKQNVSYEFNWERFKRLADAREDNITLKSYLKNKEIVQSFTLKNQVIYVTSIMALKNLHLLRLKSLTILEPEHAFDYSIEHMLEQKYFQTFENWLLQSCQENKEEFRKKALPKIEADIDRLRKILFDQKPIS
jgi:DNA-binding transcriptional ArsR family regulator